MTTPVGSSGATLPQALAGITGSGEETFAEALAAQACGLTAEALAAHGSVALAEAGAPAPAAGPPPPPTGANVLPPTLAQLQGAGIADGLVATECGATEGLPAEVATPPAEVATPPAEVATPSPEDPVVGAAPNSVEPDDGLAGAAMEEGPSTNLSSPIVPDAVVAAATAAADVPAVATTPARDGSEVPAPAPDAAADPVAGVEGGSGSRLLATPGSAPAAEVVEAPSGPIPESGSPPASAGNSDPTHARGPETVAAPRVWPAPKPTGNSDRPERLLAPPEAVRHFTPPKGLAGPEGLGPLDAPPGGEAASEPTAPSVVDPRPATVVPTGGRPERSPATAAAVRRVLDAVDRLLEGPPPRRMVVELPQLDGLRIVVEARGTGVVLHPLGDGSTSAAFDSLARDVAAELAARGLDAGTSGERERRPPSEDESPVPTPAGRAQRPRRDGGLRL